MSQENLAMVLAAYQRRKNLENMVAPLMPTTRWMAKVPSRQNVQVRCLLQTSSVSVSVANTLRNSC